MAILNYNCRNQNLAQAVDEMADWLAQQLVLRGESQISEIRICCSRQAMSLAEYQHYLPIFKQRLDNIKQAKVVFTPHDSGPHLIELEIKQMSQGWIGKTLGNLKDMFREEDTPPANKPPSSGNANSSVSIQAEAGPYEPIRQGIDLACRQLQQSIRAHVVIAPEDVLVVRRVRVRGIDEASKNLLQGFEREFGVGQRSRYIQKLLQDQRASAHLELHELVVEFEHDPPNEALDAFECFTQALNRNEASSGVDVQLFGAWEQRTVAEPVSSPAPAPLAPATAAPSTPPPPAAAPLATPVALPATNSGVSLLIRIWDGGPARELTIQQFPYTIGKASHQQLVLPAAFVSSAHLVINWQADSGFTLCDVGSTNGTWFNQEKNRLAPQVAQALKAADVIRLAAALDDSRDLSSAPRIEVISLTQPGQAQATPVILPPAASCATPVVMAPVIALAQLQIVDADGERSIRIERCPFAIGRAQDQHYVVPQSNPNVSGNHLVISEISNGRAKVKNLAWAKNGCAWLEQPSQKLAAEFDWPLGKTLLLAPADHNNPLKLTLSAA